MTKLDTFTRAYIETALWAEMDNADETGGQPLDRNYSVDDIHPDTLAAMVADCAAFQSQCDDAISAGGCDWSQAGHDFWLTRNGHGAGFWDGDWPEPQASALTTAAEQFGEVDLYVGDDGMIHH